MTPENIAALFSQGLACHQRGELQQAEFIYHTVILLDPGHFDALHLAGVICAQRNLTQPGSILILRALRIQPNSPSANQNLGNILADKGDQKAALDLYWRAIALNPGHVDAYFNLTQNLLTLGNHNEALVVADWNRHMRPQNAETQRLWIKALAQKGLTQNAILSCDLALEANPGSIEIRQERASLLQHSSEFSQAICEFERILVLNPGEGSAFINLSKCYLSLNDLMLAERASRRAIHIYPEMPEARINLGGVFQKRRDLIGAETLYRTGIVLNPAHEEGLRHLGVLFSQDQQYDLSINILKWVLHTNPNIEFVTDRLLSNMAKTCNWSEFDSIRNQIQSHRNIAAEPMNCLWVFDDAESILAITQKYVSKMGFSRKNPRNIGKQEPKRIRVGYFSSDFKKHPVAYNLMPLLKHHNRDRFEIVGFDFTLLPDAYSSEILGCLDSHHPVRDLSDEAAAELSRELNIDIAIDLNGHTGDSRTRIFLYPAAPIQINYLGFPGTMGTDVHDFIVADSFVIPEESSRFYTERVLRLPSFFMPYEFKHTNPATSICRADFNLPEEAFVFASFNNLSKLTPEHFRTWMRILESCQHSVLWMAISGAEQNVDRILREARKCGIDSKRIIFASHVQDLETHISRLGLADLMLDTYPYNGHTTACDAIQAGLPILTRCGETFASRVVSSLLTTLKIPELISTDQESYIQKAVELSNDSSHILGIRSKISRGKTIGLLPDARSYALHFESLLEEALAQGFV